MILSVSNIKKSFGEKEVLKNISFHIEEHEKVAFIGNNGAGKTTLFHIIQKAGTYQIDLLQQSMVSECSHGTHHLGTGAASDNKAIHILHL